jgi:hypothetical protein
MAWLIRMWRLGRRGRWGKLAVEDERLKMAGLPNGESYKAQILDGDHVYLICD